jgi:isoaspartyl peptidase/L-asparaginase-like protein (Ntn-hydrolase superfamily)
VNGGSVVIGSERSEVGLGAAMDILRDGGGAVDAVEAAMRRCEDNVADHYVGTGGLPNARGEVELDASLMVGSTRAFGAVGAVKGFPNPISIARAVLQELPQHCLLVGAGAELFAEENGFERAELLTDESRRMFRDELAISLEAVERSTSSPSTATVRCAWASPRADTRGSTQGASGTRRCPVPATTATPATAGPPARVAAR